MQVRIEVGKARLKLKVGVDKKKKKVKGRYREVDISGWINTREACILQVLQTVHVSQVTWSYFILFF